ncbi:MAG: anti-sigma-D factor RsdA [Mycobacterium sp.]|uniref:anti-sigma-D factor RsdA n=1 Tax=Mycobacterium sp. TaxID=1785 RepID=UPI003CC5B5A5
MSERGPDPVATDLLTRTDRFVDALAAGDPVDTVDNDRDDDVLAGLLGEWRDELRRPSSPALVPEEAALIALRSGRAVRADQRHGLTLVASVAAAILAFGGLGVMVADAQPGGPLYSVHTVLFGQAPVDDDQIELTAKNELAEVQQMIAQGRWDQAQGKLAVVNDTVQNVNDTNRKQNLINQVNRLNAKVATRNPDATTAPGG